MNFTDGFNNMFNGMFGKVQSGQCRLAMNGRIAVKTSSGYKTYDLKKNRLTNCSNFVFNGMDEFFFVIPTNKVQCGDIILKNGQPRCVIKVENNQITAVNYEDSTVETILPERHVFMGNTYFYGKIVSMFGGTNFKGKNGFNNMLKYMMLSEMMKGNGNTSNSMFGNMMPFMMMGGSGMDMFDGLFDFDDVDMALPMVDTDDNDDNDDNTEDNE
jgi:hypothetical protein